MNRRGWMVFWVVFALCAFAASATWAQEEDDPPAEDEDEEVLNEDEEEGLGEEEGAEETTPEEEARSDREVSYSPGIHPSYTLTYDRNRDQATWNHAFKFDYGYTPRISLGSSSSIRKKSSLTADRVSRVRNSSTGIVANSNSTNT